MAGRSQPCESITRRRIDDVQHMQSFILGGGGSVLCGRVFPISDAFSIDGLVRCVCSSHRAYDSDPSSVSDRISERTLRCLEQSPFNYVTHLCIIQANNVNHSRAIRKSIYNRLIALNFITLNNSH